MTFLERALAWFAGLGVTVERVMTDNGSAYVCHAFRQAIQDAGLKYKRTRPYTPRTIDSSAVDPVPQGTARPASRRGKAEPPLGLRGLRPRSEQSIQTSLREWAYLQAFASSAERTAAMHPWLHGYNRWRPHSALGGKPPLSRVPGDNLRSNDS